METGLKILLLLLITLNAAVQANANGSRLREPRSSASFPLRRDASWKGVEDEGTWIWPLPAEWAKGTTTLAVDPGLELQGNGSDSSIVKQAFERYIEHIFVHQGGKDLARKLRRPHSGAPSLQRLVVNVISDDETLNLGTDESYTLNVPAEGKTTEAYLEAATIYGALRGLETFSQLTRFNFTKREVVIAETPWVVKDEPRFKFRGLLIDTSRHYLPVETIRKIIDSMAYAKLNVLHWHIVDEQSFPMEIPSYPNLWKGAYTKAERYTVDDAEGLVKYAQTRGINIMAELDVPGHAASWGVGYPELWPSPTCQTPLDVSKNFTFEVITAILTDLHKIFPFELFHLGGDEVDTTCWEETPHIKAWLDDHGLSPQDAYANFVLQAQKLALSLNWTPVNWEEPFTHFPDRLDPHTVIHEWLSNDIVPDIVQRGLKTIVSNQDVWYLDHLDSQWEGYYLNEPLGTLTDPELAKLVLGGEVCMWGESADPSQVEATIWPRAAAAAERLWSPASSTDSIDAALPRLEHFRCLLNERGVGAAPVLNTFARQGPPFPGSCYYQ